jgi:tetratricopeptide (TPR) repeat protein
MNYSYIDELAIILCSGAFGGIVLGIWQSNSFKLRLPFSGKLIEIGFIGDGIIGAAASIAIYFVAGSLFNISLKNIETIDHVIKLIALGILSGFAGIKVLTGMSNKIIKRVSSIEERITKVEKNEQINELIRHADFLMRTNKLNRSLIVYKKALEFDPESEPALIGLAKVYRRLGKWEDAISILNKVVDKHPQSERAYYNRACYKNLCKKYDKESILSDLKASIKIYPEFNEYAKDDEDFESINDDTDFLEIVLK